MADALTIDSVSKSFGDVTAVDHLSATLPTGCIYGFLGPNGAGKTTTIRMIMDIIRPDSGAITLLGERTFAAARDRIGYLPEERGLYRKMTVRDVITYIAGIKGMDHARIRRVMPERLEAIGLADWADKKVENLSKGMHQKLQFLVTVINDPELVILDEPFSGLDPINLDLIRDMMVAMRDAGKTVVYSTHMMEHAEKLCDYVMLINRGKKVFDGSLDDIRSRYTADTVAVELDGDMSFIAQLPGVVTATKDGRRTLVTLAGGSDNQKLLQDLAARSRIRSFEVKAPSLHEIFVKEVRAHA